MTWKKEGEGREGEVGADGPVVARDGGGEGAVVQPLRKVVLGFFPQYTAFTHVAILIECNLFVRFD